MCGENKDELESMSEGEGSSPRVRGKRRLIDTHRPARGLIPACAGKTRLPRIPASSSAAHPRVCGENRRPRPAAALRWGSSPRVRGKRVSKLSKLFGKGLIPACAGKTIRAKSQASSVRAHPRVCGENASRLARSSPRAGSSPRVRGKPRETLLHVGREGLIPACAGKTTYYKKG